MNPDSKNYDKLITFTYNRPPPQGNTATKHITIAKQRLYRLSGIDENNFDNFRDQAHLPMAITKHFGLGALLFLPEGKDAYRQIHTSRTALYSIFDLIRQADVDGVLVQVADRLWVEIIWSV